MSGEAKRTGPPCGTAEDMERHLQEYRGPAFGGCKECLALKAAGQKEPEIYAPVVNGRPQFRASGYCPRCHGEIRKMREGWESREATA